MRRSLRITIAVFFTASILSIAPGPLNAGEVARKVGSGESLALICKKAYGDKDLYILVALYNGKKDPSKISAGETLRLPYSDGVSLRKGESLSKLAKRVWGEAKMYPVLAWANGIKDVAKVPAGTRLAVPVLVPYTLKKGQSVSSVAGEFYGNPKAYEIILNASRIDDPTRLPAGAELKIPYVMPKPVVKKTAVKPVSRPVPKPAPKPVVKKPAADPEALKLLGQAETAFREGRYGDAWTLADKAADRLGGKEKAKTLRLMAACQYAFGKTDAALDALKRAYELDPGFTPDPAYVNPEMLALYDKASNQ